MDVFFKVNHNPCDDYARGRGVAITVIQVIKISIYIIMLVLNYIIVNMPYKCDIFGVIMFGCSLMQPLSTRG